MNPTMDLANNPQELPEREPEHNSAKTTENLGNRVQGEDTMSSLTITSLPKVRCQSILRTALLLSLLALYLVIVMVASSNVFEGDEGGYVYNATRMVHGPAVSPQDLRLWWGPGYPLFLIPFIVIGAPWIVVKLLNAVLLFGAIIYFYALLRRYLLPTPALIVTLCLGLYPPLMRSLHVLSPETLAVYLICGFMFHACALYNQARHHRLNLFVAAMYLAYLALTKVFFGYVIAVASVFLAVSLVSQRTKAFKKALPIFLLALMWCIPYLLYTYSLTGKVFYWSTSGGMQLYWMTTPDANELGSWFSAKEVKERPELAAHREFFATLDGLSDTERDDAFKKQAIYNLAHHPAKYFYNWMANVGRLLFSYPFSFGPQSLSTFFYLVPNMFIVVLSVIGIIPALLRPRAIPFELWAVLAFVLIALGGSSLLSAYDRQFRPLVPGLVVWLAFVYTRVMRIELRTDMKALASDLSTTGLAVVGILEEDAVA